MLKLLLMYIFLAHLIGCILVEYFEFYSYSSGRLGYYNGSWLIYLLNNFVFFLVIVFVLRIRFGFIVTIIQKYNFKFSKSILYKTFFYILIFFFLTLFLFGGYKVLLGQVSKGEFRSKEIGSLGFGFLAFLIIKFYVPSLLAYLASIHKYKKKIKKYILILAFLFSSLIGLSWGFKSSAITILMPAFIIIFDKLEFLKFMKMSLIFIILIYISAVLFDKEIVETYNISFLELILLRITVIEGDSFWTIYDGIKNGIIEPLYFDYFKYLLSFFGNKIFYLFGTNMADPDLKVQYSLSSYLTYLVSGDLSQATSGEHNVTVTYVGEGLIFLGYPRVFLFSIFAGILTGLNIKILQIARKKENLKILSLFSSIFVFLTWSWLKGGDITSVFHISNFIGIISTYLLLILVEKRLKSR